MSQYLTIINKTLKNMDIYQYFCPISMSKLSLSFRNDLQYTCYKNTLIFVLTIIHVFRIKQLKHWLSHLKVYAAAI